VQGKRGGGTSGKQHRAKKKKPVRSISKRTKVRDSRVWNKPPGGKKERREFSYEGGDRTNPGGGAIKSIKKRSVQRKRKREKKRGTEKPKEKE